MFHSIVQVIAGIPARVQTATHAKCRHLAKEESNYSIIPHFIDGLTQSGESVLHTETLTSEIDK